jgi:beta-carotene 3-hydroxylase
MQTLYYIAITTATFAFMEFMAWATHKYVMHGFLWYLHKDHHQKEAGFFEKNDAFFIIFALPSACGFIFGSATQYKFLFFIGLGIALYGLTYFLIHDVYIHRRFKWFNPSDHWYFRGIRKAHQVHHQNLDKEKGQCFGMLLAPFRFFKKSKV